MTQDDALQKACAVAREALVSSLSSPVDLVAVAQRFAELHTLDPERVKAILKDGHVSYTYLAPGYVASVVVSVAFVR